MCFFDAGGRSFYTRDQPVNTPADLDGLRIRTQESATAMRMVLALIVVTFVPWLSLLLPSVFGL